jgi:glycosyltransferase involved in cell wall biosynthesis
MSHQLSAVIITLNEEHALPKCLDSLSFADEIVVVDSGSTDRTIEIAKDYGARVIQQDWLGYGPQKQFGVDQARFDWVLCIDADEWVSEKLSQSIVKEMMAPSYSAYECPRCNKFMGRWLRHGEGYPDYGLRLFDRQKASWSEDNVHEKVVTASPVGRLSGDLMHESEEGLSDYMEKQDRYTDFQADSYANESIGVLIVKAVFSPVVRFIKMYLLRFGFLDGKEGLIHISIGCYNSHMKYFKAFRKKMEKSSE